MAQTKMATILIAVFLLTSLAVEGRVVNPGDETTAVATADVEATPICKSVHGTELDETCTSVAQKFQLTFEAFLAINPNINCDSIFVGQWLCVKGTLGRAN
ncbi:OLC1v1000786C1 [Oldenlandia corymbosa var. corymbosa]|uniref:OLC1v1000786C1 n=1 Tax=Oldenlandia corymbosa var. corymbosa TaxID=529605 RepID=A0AAV1D3S8_OLDCO|nr:OLC1v1000786C1 [Oldenlandia corymbosa var. corymbosa]